MKKIFILLIGAFLFASNGNYEKMYNGIMDALNALNAKVDKQQEEIERLKKAFEALQKQKSPKKEVKVINSCKKIDVKDLKYKYVNSFFPYYKISFELKNNYPNEVTYIQGYLIAEDKDKTRVLEDYIDRKVNIKSNSFVKIQKAHEIRNELEKYLKDENVKDLRIYFKPTRIEFKNKKVLECN
jgi:PP-loop superfamily ATP-utilizing enzyme